MVFANFDLELELWSKYQLIAGVDEVGRGCFAGPVVAGAVIFPINSVLISGIADSKLLNPEKRKELELKIKQAALCWALGEASVSEINQVGIGKATQLAFARAIKALSSLPEFILIDAFFIDEFAKQVQRPIKNGDKVCASIAAASIIAKVYRDSLMEKLDLEYPQYGFSKHKGYGTKTHRDAIKEHGLSDLHRTSFNLSKFL